MTAEPSTKISAWEWTPWPTQPLPTPDILERLARKQGARFVDDWHRQREDAIKNERHDPLRYGWEAPPLLAARQLLQGQYVPGRFGPVVAETHPAGPALGAPLPAADDLLLMTGNRFGKSNFGGRYAVETLESTAHARVRCWSQSIDTSRSVQQTAVFKHLHPGLRKVKRSGQFCKISYTAATGFTEETLLFPQGRNGDYAQGWFLTYHSWQQDRTIAEGPGVTLTWCDEEVPAELLDTLRYRVGDNSRMVLLVTFTPLTGYTDAVGQYIEGARIIEAVPARRVVYDWWKRTWAWGEWLLPPEKELVPGCPPGHVPFILEHTQVPGRYTLCAGTVWNPYIPVEEVIKKAASQQLEIKLIRWFGWPTRKVRPALSFCDAHIVSPHNIPPLESLTIYLCVDPCPPPRNWFMVWLGVDPEGRIWVLAEWPDLEVGEWAVPGTEPDGKPGPGAYDGGGRGFDAYKLLILEREGWRSGADGIWQPGPQAVQLREGDRYLDPRAASWKVPSQTDAEAVSYIDCLLEPVARTKEGGGKEVIAPGLDFQRAPACHVQEGNELINRWLTAGWEIKERLTPMNAPRFYINAGLRWGEAADEPKAGMSEPAREDARPTVHPFLRAGCGNTIWSLRTFTGKKRPGASGAAKSDEDSACKDPIDCLKAAAKAEVRYIAPGAFGAYGKAFGL